MAGEVLCLTLMKSNSIRFAMDSEYDFIAFSSAQKRKPLEPLFGKLWNLNRFTEHAPLGR